jgi:hypothetical protein
MPKYMLFTYGDPARWHAIPPEQAAKNSRVHADFQIGLGPNLVQGEELDVTAVTTLRGDAAGGTTVKDGPFLEAEESMGGIYLVRADSLDEIVELAAQLPEAHDPAGGVEIRLVVDHGEWR